MRSVPSIIAAYEVGVKPSSGFSLTAVLDLVLESCNGIADAWYVAQGCLALFLCWCRHTEKSGTACGRRTAVREERAGR